MLTDSGTAIIINRRFGVRAVRESGECVQHGGRLEQKVRQVLVCQAVAAGCLLAGVVAHNAWTVAESPEIRLVSTLSGSVLALCGTLLNARSVRKSSGVAARGNVATLIPIFSGLLSKLVIVGGGIAFGLVYLDLDPVLLVASYLLIQFMSAWVFFRPGRAGPMD